MNSNTPATFYQRTAAWALDAFLFQIAFIVFIPKAPDFSQPLTLLTMEQAQHYLVGVLTTGLLIFLVYCAYHVLMEKTFSTTLGKFAVGLEVVYHQLTWKNVVQRFLGCVLSWLAFNIGHLMILKKSTALHDQLSNTKVVYAPHSFFGNTPALSPLVHKIALIFGLAWVAVIVCASVFSLCAALLNITKGVIL